MLTRLSEPGITHQVITSVTPVGAIRAAIKTQGYPVPPYSLVGQVIESGKAAFSIPSLGSRCHRARVYRSLCDQLRQQFEGFASIEAIRWRSMIPCPGQPGESTGVTAALWH